MPTLYIIRGLPGSGKTTFAKSLMQAGLVVHYWEADDFMKDSEGNYNFDPAKLQECHHRCKNEVYCDMQQGLNVAVSNTSTTDKEIKSYLAFAREFEYDVVSLVVENRHGNPSVHDVPQSTVQAMRDRFSIQL